MAELGQGMIVRPQQERTPATTGQKSEQARVIAETQASMTIAKQFPRDVLDARDRILNACGRPKLAESALYEYSRGGTAITGPSIRLAEALAQAWGNLAYGIRELDQRDGVSTVEAYCWDIETNTRQVKQFEVKHIRHTKKKGSYRLEDPRDIYEMIANNGARRLRACILGIIPGDIVDEAVEQCAQTLKASADVSPAAMKAMIEKFLAHGVTREQIEKRIQRRLDSITAGQVVVLRKIYNSLQDGMSVASDWFEVVPAAEDEAPAESKKDALKKKLKQAAPKKEEEPPKKEEQDGEKIECPDCGDMILKSYCETSCKNKVGCPSWADLDIPM